MMNFLTPADLLFNISEEKLEEISNNGEYLPMAESYAINIVNTYLINKYNVYNIFRKYTEVDNTTTTLFNENDRVLFDNKVYVSKVDNNSITNINDKLFWGADDRNILLTMIVSHIMIYHMFIKYDEISLPDARKAQYEYSISLLKKYHNGELTLDNTELMPANQGAAVLWGSSMKNNFSLTGGEVSNRNTSQAEYFLRSNNKNTNNSNE